MSAEQSPPASPRTSESIPAQPTDKELKRRVRKNVGPELLKYHKKRKAGRIEQREDWGWGDNAEEKQERAHDINDGAVTRHFHKIDWNKGDTSQRSKWETQQPISKQKY